MSSDQDFKAFFAAALDAVLIVDDARVFIDVNPAAQQLLGAPAADLVGRRFDHFLHSNVGLDAAWRTFLTTGRQTGELRLVCADATVRDVEYAATAHFLHNRHLAVLRDVSDRKQEEIERAELLSRQKRRLRETETLLTVSRTLSATLDPTETMRRVAREIAHALGADMVGAFLAGPSGDDLRPVAGYRVPQHMREAFQQFPIPITNHAAIEGAWGARRAVWTDDMAANPRVDRESFNRFPHQSDLFVPICIKERPVGGFFVIWWTERRSITDDEVRLVQGISDLAGMFLDNAQLYRAAAEANRAKDEFLATLSHELRNPLGAIVAAVIGVTDTGRGIRPEMLPRVFELFAQAEQPLDRSLGGLGVGLTLTRRLVELHGGAITAFSEGEGRGAQFSVRLPLDVTTAPPRPPSEPLAHGRPRRILIIEDSPDARESLRLLLESQGHHVSEASDGVGGVTLALAEGPDVILIDLGLPGLDGYEVARTLRGPAFGKTATLIAVTGYGQTEDRRRSSEAGFDAHLVKPVSPEALARLLATSSESDA